MDSLQTIIGNILRFVDLQFYRCLRTKRIGFLSLFRRSDPYVRHQLKVFSFAAASQLVGTTKPSIKLHKEPMLTRSIASTLRQTSCGWLWNRSSNPFINNPLVIVCLEAHIRLPLAIRCAAFWKVTFFCWSREWDSNPQPTDYWSQRLDLN